MQRRPGQPAIEAPSSAIRRAAIPPRISPISHTISTTTMASGTSATILQAIGIVTSLGRVSSAYVAATVLADAQITATSSGNSNAIRAARMRRA